MNKILAAGAIALTVLVFGAFKLYMLGLPAVCQ